MSSAPGGETSYLFRSASVAYAVVFTVAFLVLLSTSLLVYFFCCHHRFSRRNPNPNSGSGVLPRVFFIPQIRDPDDLPALGIGLDQSVINSYAKFPFRRDGGGVEGGESLCSICLYHYREGEMLRRLPDCGHPFHMRCVDTWLRLNPSCPICRTSPLPTPVQTPVPTPLSEFVPLSHYPIERRSR